MEKSRLKKPDSQKRASNEPGAVQTNILRTVVEDPETGGKRARWIKRGPDHYAHADSYAEIAHKRLNAGKVTVTIISPWGD